MAEYDPPIYDVSVFNPAYFLDEDEITKSYLRANFLEFPIGQGLETLPDLRVENTSIHLGKEAGLNTQGDFAISIGNSAGKNNQSVRGVAIGDFAGSVSQGNSSVAVGNFAGNDNQQSGAVAIGIQAGQNNQGANSVAIGSYAGYSGGNLGEDSIAIGNAARATGVEAVSIGHNAISTGDEAVCIGHNSTAGAADAVVIGHNNTGADNSVILGHNCNGADDCVSIGHNANAAGTNSVSIGDFANTQGNQSVAIGDAANTGLADKSIAIGLSSRALGNESIAIGDGATTSSFTNSVAIGNGATANNNNEVKLSDKASFIGDATQGWVFGNMGVAGWAGLQNINYARDGTKYALLQNASIGRTAVGAPTQINLNVSNSLRAYIDSTLHINTAGISYDATTIPSGTSNNQIGFRWKGSSAQVAVAVDNVLAGFFASLSDRRAKKNIVDYTDGLTGIMKLKPKQYEFLKIDVAKCDLTADNCIIRDLSGNTIEYDSEGNCCDDTETYGELNTGLILDEVRPIFPEVCEGGDENSIGTINYAGLVPMLIKAVQQQQEQIEALKLEVEALKNP